jgi:hypothetical protein
MSTQVINTNRCDRLRSRAGSALITVLGLLLLMVLATATVTVMTGQSAFRSRKVLRASRALSIAEAGIADILDRMHTNYAGGINIAYGSDYDEGRFDVTTKRDGTTGRILISSVGTFREEKRTTRLELIGDTRLMWDALLLECAIIAGGDATLETAAPIINGRVHANGSILHKSGNLQVNGDLTACGVVQLPAKTGYRAVPGHPPIVVPNFLPFDSWKQKAIDGGLYYNGSQVWNKVNLAPSNGVVYVEGDVEINNQSSLVGTLVVSGSISINNKFDQTQTTPRWPSLLAGVDVNLNNRNRYTGAVFAGNNIVTRNNKVINGQLIALNNIYLENRGEIPAQTTSPLFDPSGAPPTPEIVVGGWLE